jgi:hypothetical protein
MVPIARNKVSSIRLPLGETSYDHIRQKIEPYRTTTQLLLMNGVDHLEAQENLTIILAGLRKENPSREVIVHSTLPDYVTPSSVNCMILP